MQDLKQLELFAILYIQIIFIDLIHLWERLGLIYEALRGSN